ncbi:oxepin-CoA hydrolase, alternative type [Paracoccaceae bacterium GXU_MW_L88]
MSETDLLVARHGPTVLLTLNRPERRNALSPAIYQGLMDAMTEAATDPEIANIVIEGAGGFFCAGGDLDALAERASLPEAERAEKIEALHSMIRAVRRSPKPVIAAIEGGAAGAGASLAFAADLLVAAENARFTMAYVKIGLVPDGGATASLARALPPQMAAEICLLGEPVAASRLAELGVVNRLAEPGCARAAALTLAAELATGARTAQSVILSLLNQAGEEDFIGQLENEKRAMATALGGTEVVEGIAAFKAKRAPDFNAISGRESV